MLTADPRHNGRRAVVLGLWALLVLLLASQHVFWRDEVRALSIAIRGDDVLAMLRGLQGEGHPALWYLLLRFAHSVIKSPIALPVASLVVAASAATLIALRAPLGLPLLVLFLAGRAPLYEYSVMARNYGISMLLMFAFAALYYRFRTRSVVLGLLLALLANTNVHSLFIAAALLAYWGLDLWREPSVPRRRSLRLWAVNTGLFAAGALACVLTVFPPVNDAAQIQRAIGWQSLAAALVSPAFTFGELVGVDAIDRILRAWGSSFWEIPRARWLFLPLSVLLFGSILVLARNLAAAAVAVAALLAMSLLFTVVYPGSFRHQALWLCLLITLLWIVDTAPSTKGTAAIEATRRVGLGLLVGLLLIQVALGVVRIWPFLMDGQPESRSRDFARLIESRPDLRRATVVADPDYLLEPLPYYLGNPTYLTRDRTLDNVVVFRKFGRLVLTLAELLEEARAIKSRTNEPVVILLQHRIDHATPANSYAASYNQRFETTPVQAAAFLAATTRIARFGEACCSDESFDVYVLD